MNSPASRVRITRAGEVSTICPESWPSLPTDEVRTAMTPVAGGALVTDPRFPDREVGAWLTDLDAAAWWLAGVFGEQVALAVLDAEAGEGLVEVDGGELAVAAQRLAMANWLLRWWPSADRAAGIRRLDAALLRAEIGTAAWQAEPCLPDDDLATRLLDEGAAAVGRAIGMTEGLVGAEREQAEQLVWTAARAVLEEGDPGQPGWQALAKLWQRRAETKELTAQLLAEFDGFTAEPAEPGLALVAGDDGDGWELETRVADADWLQVNPRMVAAQPGNVVVTVREAGAERQKFVVEVLAGDEPAREGLRARIYPGERGDDMTLPVAQLVLRLQGHVYRGEVITGVLGSFDVDVYHPHYLAAPRFGSQPDEDRDWVRQVVGERLVSPLANPAGPFACELLGGENA